VLKTGLATLGGLGVASSATLAGLAGAAAHVEGGHVHTMAGGREITVHPVSHASFVLETPGGVLYVDPVGGGDAYADFPEADLVLLTHEHGDHYDVPTLGGIVRETTRLVTNPAVFALLPDALKGKAEAIGNGESTVALDIGIEAIPAYNLAEDRLKFHPKGRDNGYVPSIDGGRVYVAGDTEAVPEMRALENIDVAFVPMNLPYTMGIEQAAEGVVRFAPSVVYPYHCNDSDIEAFASLVGESGKPIDVAMGAWYA